MNASTCRRSSRRVFILRLWHCRENRSFESKE